MPEPRERRLSTQMTSMRTPMTTKMPTMPLRVIMRVWDSVDGSNVNFISALLSYSPATSERMRPPAMTEAICPLTLAPAACMSR